MSKYIDKETARRIIDYERSKEQILNMLDNVPTADVLDMNVGDMVSRTAVIKIFSQLWDCIEEIADKEEWEDVCKTTANELPSAQQWIPCSEKLPETDNKANINEYDVLLLVRPKDHPEQIPQIYIGKLKHINGDDGSGNFFKIKIPPCDWTIWGWSYFREPEVLAWMPLPEPYKEVEE